MRLKPAIPVRLITIPVSHYCEKTRWALNRANILFIEESHMPPFHRFATQKFTTRSRNSTVMQNERKMSVLNRLGLQLDRAIAPSCKMNVKCQS